MLPLSVIIPCLNEADRLPALLRALRNQQEVSLEILVADGGSSDGSREAATALDVRVVDAERGRARQMNAAARHASSLYLLFLHADSAIDDPALLRNALTVFKNELTIRGHDRIAGHFRLRFDHREPGHDMAWRYIEEKTAFNRPHTTNGDQGFLLTRRYFESLGGFDERLPFLEDQRLAAQIRADGLWITLPGVLHSSARRFEQAGLHNQYTLMVLIMAAYVTGLDAFFERAPQIYRTGENTGHVLLTPYIRLMRQLQREMNWRQGLRFWLRIGRLSRMHMWQPFYFVDVMLRPLLGQNRYPCLRFFERVLEPFTDNLLCDVLAVPVAWLHFNAVMTPWFWLKERGWREKDS